MSDEIKFDIKKELEEITKIREARQGISAIAKTNTKNDPVTHPSHYTQGKIASIRFIIDQKFDFLAGSVIKYIVRYRWKGNPIQDLEKARWFINRLLREERAKK